VTSLEEADTDLDYDVITVDRGYGGGPVCSVGYKRGILERARSATDTELRALLKREGLNLADLFRWHQQAERGELFDSYRPARLDAARSSNVAV
jgi:hypothetical protein